MIMLRYSALLFILAALTGCAPKPPTHSCKNPGIVPIGIHYGTAELRVEPANKDAELGDALKFNLIGDLGIAVEVSPKDSGDTWLQGDGKNRFFIVCVPEDVLPTELDEKEFGYEVTVEGIGILDPVVTIHRF